MMLRIDPDVGLFLYFTFISVRTLVVNGVIAIIATWRYIGVYRVIITLARWWGHCAFTLVDVINSIFAKEVFLERIHPCWIFYPVLVAIGSHYQSVKYLCLLGFIPT